MNRVEMKPHSCKRCLRSCDLPPHSTCVEEIINLATHGVSLTTVFGRGLANASLNINSLLSHIDELRVFISCSKVDILTIINYKLDYTIHDNDFYLHGFEIVRRDRRVNGRKEGGVCIFLRTNLNFRIRDDLNNDKFRVFVYLLKSTCFEVQDSWSAPWYRVSRKLRPKTPSKSRKLRSKTPSKSQNLRPKTREEILHLKSL